MGDGGSGTLGRALEHDGQEIPRGERLVVIEDAPEIRLDHPNAVGLIATYPNLLAGEDDPSERTRLVLIEREVAIADSPDGAGRLFRKSKRAAT